MIKILGIGILRIIHYIKVIYVDNTQDILNSIKRITKGMEITIFYNDTRLLTTLKDDNGNYLVGTKASDSVVDHVLKRTRI